MRCDLPFDSVGIVEIKPTARIIVAVVRWLEPRLSNTRLDRVDVFFCEDRKMIQHSSRPIGINICCCRFAWGKEGDISRIRSNVDGTAGLHGRPRPADRPPENIVKPSSGGVRVRNGDIGVLQFDHRLSFLN